MSLEGKRVVDAGAGTGRVALEATETADQVFAVEPVARLRQFIREKASRAGLDNVFVVDGFLHALPFPDDWAGILITSHALGGVGGRIGRVGTGGGGGGFIIQCPGTAEAAAEEEQHRRLVSSDWGYEFSRYREADGWKRKYWKRI